MGRDYYKILEISRDADAATIKKAYRYMPQQPCISHNNAIAPCTDIGIVRVSVSSMYGYYIVKQGGVLAHPMIQLTLNCNIGLLNCTIMFSASSAHTLTSSSTVQLLKVHATAASHVCFLERIQAGRSNKTRPHEPTGVCL